MANYEEMWNMLANHVFEIDSQLSDHVRCIMCSKLLNDAYMGPCGCSYCKRCIGNYLKDDEKYCPGDSSDCKLHMISISKSIVKDLTATKIISQFNVKCPVSLCPYRTTIIQMPIHLQICDKKETTCPFIEFGCSADSMERKMISDHLLSNMLEHTKLLIDCLMSIKNESIVFRENFQEKISKVDLEEFKQELKSKITCNCEIKEDEIENLKNELRNLKVQNEDLAIALSDIKMYSDIKIQNLMDAKKKLEKELSQFRGIQKNEFKQIKENQKREIQKLKQELEMLQSKFHHEIDSNLTQNIEESGDELKNHINLETLSAKQKKKKKKLKNVMEVVPKESKLTGSFVWNITGISNSAIEIAGNHFFTCDKQYKMCLWLFPRGRDEFVDSHVSVEFDILDAPGGPNSGWTFNGLINITIKNITQINDGLQMSERCSLNRSKRFELIHFSNDDLKSAGVNLTDDFVLQCHVNSES